MKKKKNLIIFLNRRCTMGCLSCNVNASASNSKELTAQWVEAFFNKIDTLVFSGYIIWTGGEPFLSFEALKKGISFASQKKFRSEILTSGICFESHPQIMETMATAGDFSIRISLDAEHQDRVPLSLIISLIKKALQSGIEVNFTIREIPGRKELVDDYLEEIKAHLPGFYRNNRSRSRWIHYIPHIPVFPENAHQSSVNIKCPGKQGWKNTCKMGFKDLVIGEDGLIYPCCGLFGIDNHEQLAMGDALKESLENLERVEESKSLFKVLREKGPYAICMELGLVPETWDWPPYESPCHLCLALFYRHGDRIADRFLDS